jgi:ABC-2 type transport system ATP-binding protein
MLAKAFIAEPKVILLDEPTAALDPDIAQDVRHFVLQQQKERGVSILFTSHNMNEVAEVCNRVLVLKQGTIIADATPTELAASVSTARIELAVTEGLEQLKEHLDKRSIKYAVEQNHIARVVVEIDEQKIASLLLEIARLGVIYSYISIDKPTLEDYFLYIAQQHRLNHKN